jgi:hypothetical protein
MMKTQTRKTQDLDVQLCDNDDACWMDKYEQIGPETFSRTFLYFVLIRIMVVRAAK